jgi:ssDNA thymidine ADP-ribosyltransferase DarT-like protein
VNATWPSTIDPAVEPYVAARGITEVLHFTTDKGLLGIFATGAVLCRDLLDVEQYIEAIYTPNCNNRLKDPNWTGYVNLSISRVNKDMLNSSERWHSTEDLWWAVLAFDASLLAHPGVHFTTTNNTYPSLKRGTGIHGLHALFADSVEFGYYGCYKSRYPGMPDAWTTDPQAEVLYPERVSVGLLRALYVREPEHIDHVAGLMSIFSTVPRVPILHKPEVFQ